MNQVIHFPAASEVDARATVAAEVRGHLAKRRIPTYRISEFLGQSRGYWQRRVSGETAFDIDDLALMAGFLGVRLIDLIPTDAPVSPAPVGTNRPSSDYGTDASGIVTRVDFIARTRAAEAS